MFTHILFMNTLCSLLTFFVSFLALYLPSLKMALKDLYQIIGSRVKELRDLKGGLTQADLSAKTNINRATISNIESGKQQVSLHYLYLIAKALDVEAKELLPSVSEIHILPNEILDNLNEKFVEHNLDELSKNNILQALNKNPDHGK